MQKFEYQPSVVVDLIHALKDETLNYQDLSAPPSADWAFSGAKVFGGLWAASPGLTGLNGLSHPEETPLLDVVELPEGRVILMTAEEGHYGKESKSKCATSPILMVLDGGPNSCLGKGRVTALVGERGPDPRVTLTLDNYKAPVSETGMFRLDRVMAAVIEQLRRSDGGAASLPTNLVERIVAAPWQGGRVSLESLSPQHSQMLLEAYKSMVTRDLWPCTLSQHYLPRVEMFSGVGVVVPTDMWEAMAKMARAGWTPLLPIWQSLWGTTLNRMWANTCSVGRRFDLDGVPARNTFILKLLGWLGGGYTLHSDYFPSDLDPANVFPWEIPTAWRSRFVEMCEEIAGWDLPALPPVEMRAYQANHTLGLVKTSNLVVYQAVNTEMPVQCVEYIPTVKTELGIGKTLHHVTLTATPNHGTARQVKCPRSLWDTEAMVPPVEEAPQV